MPTHEAVGPYILPLATRNTHGTWIMETLSAVSIITPQGRSSYVAYTTFDLQSSVKFCFKIHDLIMVKVDGGGPATHSLQELATLWSHLLLIVKWSDNLPVCTLLVHMNTRAHFKCRPRSRRFVDMLKQFSCNLFEARGG